MTNLVNTPFKMLERMNADLNDQTAMTSSVDQESARLYSCADVDIIFLFFVSPIYSFLVSAHTSISA